MTSLEIEEEENERLLSAYDDVEWVDAVEQYRCTRCSKVLVQHFISNRQHKFCSNCKRVMDDGSQRWRCPKCREYIREIDRQDLKFRDRIRRLRLHCPHRKYGCQHICAFKDLKRHLDGCKDTRENALPVLYKGEITVEMVERMFSMQLLRLRNEMKEMKQEMERRLTRREVPVDEEQKGVKESAWELSVAVDQIKREMAQIVDREKKRKWKLRVKLSHVNDRVDGVKSDVHVETTRLRNEIKELQKQQPMSSASSSAVESLSLAVEENKAMILKLEGKSASYLEMMDFNNRKNNDLMHELKNELKTEDAKTARTMKEMALAEEKQWAEVNDKMNQCAVQIEKNKMEVEKTLKSIRADMENRKENVVQMNKTTIETINEETKNQNNKMTQQMKRETETMAIKIIEKVKEVALKLNTKITNLEIKTEENKLLIQLNSSPLSNSLEENGFHFRGYVQFRKHQLNCFTLAANQVNNFQPDFIWKLTGIKDQLKPFPRVSQAFEWTGYPGVRARARIDLTPALVHLSLRLEEERTGQAVDLKLIPKVYYVIRDQSKTSLNPKHMCGAKNHVFNAKFNYSMNFESEMFLSNNSLLLHPSSYAASDSMVVEIYVEPPTLAQKVYSYDGTLDWAIDNYHQWKEMTRAELVLCHESPYFYTAPQGYRVQVRIWLTHVLRVYVCFLPGQFDDHLPLTFPHQTTVTLFNRKAPLHYVTKTVNRDNIPSDEKSYSIDVCNEEEMESGIENDVCFYRVAIKSLHYG